MQPTASIDCQPSEWAIFDDSPGESGYNNNLNWHLTANVWDTPFENCPGEPLEFLTHKSIKQNKIIILSHKTLGWLIMKQQEQKQGAFCEVAINYPLHTEVLLGINLFT